MFISPMCATPIGISKDNSVIWEQRHNRLKWDCDKYYIEIPERFQCDFCSVPRLPLIYAKWGDRAHHEGMLHDYVYRKDCQIYLKSEKAWVVGMPRPEGDALFCNAMIIRGYGKDIAYPMWLGVRLGGWPHYQQRLVGYKHELKIVYPEAA